VALGAGLRLLALVVPSVILLPYVNPDALGDHLAQRLHLPPRPVVAATAALARFQAFGQLWAELLLARRVRGVGAGRALAARTRELAAVTFAMFVGTLGQAATLALAMDARGFAGARRRSWTGSAPWRLADSLVVLAGLLVVLTGAVARALLPR
jgi:energy-coupling factor transporter transmembrane protein EcfT